MNPERTIDFRYQPPIIQTCIGLVDDPYKTIVREDGSLNYGFEPFVFHDFQELTVPPGNQIPRRYTPTGTRNMGFRHRLRPEFTHRDTLVRRTQEYGDPEVALVTTTEEYEKTTLTWKVFAYQQEGLRADILHWHMEAAEDFGRAPSRVELIVDGSLDGLPTVIESPGTTEYWTEHGLVIPGLNHYAFLRSGDTREGVFAIILEGSLAEGTVTPQWASAIEDEMHTYWKSVRPFRNRFDIPDQQIMDMLVSCGRNILQARELKDGVYQFQVGPTIYRGLWVVDGHFFLEAAHMMGRGDEARSGIDAVLQRAKADGSIQILPGHLKETAVALATFVRQCELLDDDERLKELWPVMLRALEHLRTLRAEARAAGPGYEGYRLFPPAFADGGVSDIVPEYTTPLWAAVGLKMACEAGERLQLDRYEAFRELYHEVMAGLHHCIARDTRTTDEGIPYLPTSMVDNGYNKPQSGTWSLAHAMHPGEIFAPEDPLVQNFLRLLDAIDDEQGLPKETGWLHDQGMWSYSGAFYAQVWLYAGFPEKAVDYLYAFANHAAPSRVWREDHALVHSNSAEYCGDMPHNWASVEFIRLVRNLLVLERGGALHLLMGLPEEWLPRQDNPLVLEDTPTKYGSFSVRLTVQTGGGYHLEVSRTRGNQTPEGIIVHWHGEERILPADQSTWSVQLAE